jgi:nitrate/TMAO reductase-like tetraheme cytochrome c subunit
MTSNEGRRSGLGRIWRALWKPSKRFSIAGLAIFGAVFGILLWGGFNWGMEKTNTLEFCISCHEMEQTVYQEYIQSTHYKNPSGVRAICSDCHVPKAWGAKVWRKIKASGEIYHKLVGTIDTPEKFEEHRAELAERVWAGMRESGSRECRNCHEFDTMQIKDQRPRAQQRHPEAIQEGKTCIDCHRGLTHQLPPRDD